MPSVTIELTAELAGRMCNFVHTEMIDGGRADRRASRVVADAATLTIKHIATNRYREPVAFGQHRMMLRPRDKRRERDAGLGPLR